MKTPSFSLLQISLIFIQSIGLVNHVLVIPLLLDASGRDAWIAALATFLILIPFFLLVARSAKLLNRRSALAYLGERFGPVVSRTIAILFAIFLTLSSVVTLKDMTTWTTSSYLPLTPPYVVAASFLLICTFTASRGLRTVALSAGILLPFIVAFGEFVMAANWPHKDYGLLFPVFERGTGAFAQGIPYAGAGLVEILLLVFVQHRVSTPIKYRHLLLLAALLAGLTLGPLMGSISEFGPVEGAMQRYPSFEEWRLVKIGSFIEHVDFLSIFQWVSGAFVRLSFILWLIDHFFNHHKYALPIAFLAILGLTLYPIGDIAFIALLSKYYFPTDFYALIAMGAVLLVLFALPPKKSQGALP
ncbi:GerAB/ArcD/ProY family transporter [Cohnella cellulosilytica]|uniref:Endospore germination permease n=1 Tax=Cohnella cellulosilytica TaxID=986710 RepID=A0ABW2F1I0_9BACL